MAHWWQRVGIRTPGSMALLRTDPNPLSTTTAPDPQFTTAALIDGALHLDEFVESDPKVIEVMAEAEDLESAVHHCLRLGARIAAYGQNGLDESTVSQHFNHLTDKIDASVAQYNKVHTDSAAQHNEKIAALTNELVAGEDSVMARLLGVVRNDFAAKLTQMFDANDRTSALSLFDDAIKGSVKTTLDPNDPNTPLGQWRTETTRENVAVMRAAKDQHDALMKELREMREVLVVQEREAKAAAAIIANSAAKGTPFEDRVFAIVSQLATLHCDTPEHVGTMAGRTGGKVGDEVVVINPQDTSNHHAAFVFEMKTQKGLTMAKLLEELDRAMANRDASVGIMVVDDVAKSPAKRHLWHQGDKVIVVLEEDDAEGRWLQLAYTWARLMARQKLNVLGDTADVKGALEALAEAQDILVNTQAIKNALGKIATGQADAKAGLVTYQDKLTEAFAKIRRLLGN